MKKNELKSRIKQLTAMSYAISALDNLYPNSPEIQSRYFCIIKELRECREKDGDRAVPVGCTL